MHDFSMIRVQGLHPGDNVRRIEFCKTLLIQMQEDFRILRKLVWTDESKFSREGTINRRNWHYWASENSKLVQNTHFQQPDLFSNL